MSLILELHRDLYALTLIQKAIISYKDLANIDLKEAGNYYCCCFSNCKYDADTTKYEFANYLIDLSNSKEVI